MGLLISSCKIRKNCTMLAKIGPCLMIVLLMWNLLLEEIPLARDNSDFVFDCGEWCIVRAVVGTVTGVVVLLLCIYLTRDKWARQREDEEPPGLVV